jgi:large subunit ribosomal protein L6
MSRIGKLPIPIPDKVTVTIDGNVVSVKGPLGQMSQEFRPEVSVRVEGKEMIVERAAETRQARACHGLYRSLLNNMVVGVSEGFKRELDVIGVGYKVELKGNVVEFALGYSHPIKFALPEGVTAEVDPKTMHIVIKGYNKQVLGQTAANMRKLRAPEPYKGKGVKYTEETVRRKAGKAAGK